MLAIASVYKAPGAMASIISAAIDTANSILAKIVEGFDEEEAVPE